MWLSIIGALLFMFFYARVEYDGEHEKLDFKVDNMCMCVLLGSILMLEKANDIEEAGTDTK